MTERGPSRAPEETGALARRDRPVAPASTGPAAPTGPSGGSRVPGRERGAAPARPSLASPNAAPVLTRLPPPFTVRLSQFLWILALLAGGLTVVYYFVIREDQIPLIADAVEAVEAGRPEATYTSAADIVFWTVFWVAAGALVIQIALLVSFMNRRPHIRIYQLGTVVLVGLTYLLAVEFVATGEKGELLRQMFLAQVSLSVLALLVGSFSRALAWTARKRDVRRAGDDGGGGAEA